MTLESRTLRGLQIAGLAALVIAILAGILLPVYGDEVGWRLQERAGFDGVDKMYTEHCGPNTVARPPFWMMPARYYSSFFNSRFPDPLSVRLSGILYALAWLAMLLLLVRRIAGEPRQRMLLSILAVGFVSMGTMPLLLVWSRPEQPILLAYTAAMLIAFPAASKPQADTTVETAWLRSLGILALALIALSYHLKAIFLVPLFLACLAFASRSANAHVARLVSMVLLIGAATWAAQYWIARLECPNDPMIHANFVSNNTGAALVSASGWSQIAPLISKALSNISLFQYLGMPAPRQEPMSAWLPYHRIGLTASFTWFLVMVFAWAVTLLFALYCLVGGALHAWRKRWLDPRPVLAALLVAATMGWSATQGMRNVYEAIFVVPMMVMAVILALSTHDSTSRSSRVTKAIALGAGLLGIVSVPLVAAIYAPPLIAATAERGYLKEQPYSVSAFGYPAVRRQILAAARLCGIDDPDRGNRLLIDSITYFPFMKTHMPEHRQGLIDVRAYVPDPVGYLRGVKSDGAVVSCRGLTPELRARARREGDICCLAPPGW